MASYERTLDLVQGYNFKKDVQKPFGYITSLTIGGTGHLGNATMGIIADQKVAMPILGTTGQSKTVVLDEFNKAQEADAGLEVVSVLKSIKWELGDVDPITFEGTLSVGGKQQVMGLLYSTMISTAVQISYVIYEYDPLSFSYYQAFSSKANTLLTQVRQGTSPKAAGVQGLLRKDGDNLLLTISPDPSTEVQSPENYDFSISVAPAPIEQQLYLATANKRTVLKKWGRLGPKKA